MCNLQNILQGHPLCNICTTSQLSFDNYYKNNPVENPFSKLQEKGFFFSFWWVAGKKVQHSKNNMQMLGWCCEWWKKPHNISWTHQQQHRVGGQSSLSFQNKQIQFRIERTRIWLRIGNGKEKRIQILKIQCNTTTWYEKFEKKKKL